MASRWEQPVLEYVVQYLDHLAVGGRAINLAGLDDRLFDARPDAHPATVSARVRELYEKLARAAREAGRLAHDAPLIKGWKLTGDIYSPKLERFIEVDERQHFSRARLARLLEIRSCVWGPLYPAYFWSEEFPRLRDKPFQDLDPPHRDEARAYRDELRELLPVAYGLRRTIRLDEFTLQDFGLEGVGDLVAQALEAEARDARRMSGAEA
ncbi:MAG: hypothetical protein ACHRXM_00685 [Isosphaerales bacterium]